MRSFDTHQQLLAVVVLEDGVEGLLDEDALIEILEEAVEVLHVPAAKAKAKTRLNI
jgi:hypothetical protein